jgi:DNA-binding transcriptional ArsR family regulator
MSEEKSVALFPNRLVHEPARLAILTVLSSCSVADFLFLRNVTGLSKGNLSVQLTNLEQAGLVVINKEFVDKKTRTTVSLSQRGISEIDEYWKTMDEIRSQMGVRKKQGFPSGSIVPRPAKPRFSRGLLPATIKA